MNTNKHTPGPWEVDYSGPARLEIKGGEQSIALCNMQCDDGDVDEANAALISAAPELLAACEAVLDAMTDPNFDDHFDGAKLELMLQNVVDKARGEG